MTDFEWPCDRRVAHRPHPVIVEHCDHKRQSCEDIGCPGPVTRECPGVRAHPKTMIGGKQMEDD